MNYSNLKSMVNSLIKWYSCPSCKTKKIWEQDIDIIGAAGNTVNINMKCPTCFSQFMARVEVVWMDASKFSELWAWALKMWPESIKNTLNNINGWKNIQTSEKEIKDEAIVDLSKNLKSRKLSVEDLFKK